MDMQLYMTVVRKSYLEEKRTGKGLATELPECTVQDTPRTKGSEITIGSVIDRPPKDLKEFEDRLGMFLHDLKNLFFGVIHEVETGKRVKRDTSIASLVHALLRYEKHQNKNVPSPEMLETYPFLKLVLEKDAALFGKDRYLLGIQRNRSGLSTPKKNVIAVRCAAQVLWHLERSQIPTIEAMEDRLLDRKYPFYELLDLGRFHSPRTIEKWVRAVFPVPQAERKKHRTKNDSAFKNIIPIPNIFTDTGVSFPRLRFALICLTRILKTLNWRQRQIVDSEFSILLADPLKFYPRLYVRDWIDEAYSSNGSIFDS